MQETRPVTTSSGTPVRQPSGTSEPAQKPKLLDRVPETLRSRHYSRRTERTDCHWPKRFIFFRNNGIQPVWAKRKSMPTCPTWTFTPFAILSQLTCWKQVTIPERCQCSGSTE